MSLWNCRKSKEERESEVTLRPVHPPWREEARRGSFTWETTLAYNLMGELLTTWSPVKLPSLKKFYKLHHLSGSYMTNHEQPSSSSSSSILLTNTIERDALVWWKKPLLPPYLHIFTMRVNSERHPVNCPPIFKGTFTSHAFNSHMWI